VSLNLLMETKFPYDNHVKLTISVDRPTAVKLRLRVPSWASKEMEIVVNNEKHTPGKPGSYLTIDRIWVMGDSIAFTLPASLSVTKYTGEDQIPGHDRYVVTYGPFLYAAVGNKQVMIRLENGSHPEDIVKQLNPKSGVPLHFTVAGNPGIVYMPYWQVEQEHKSVQLVCLKRWVVALRSDINTAPRDGFNPPKPLKLLVCGAHSIRIEAKASRKCSGAGQPLTRTKLPTGNGEHKLCCQLIPERNASVACKPDLHFVRRTQSKMECRANLV